MPDGDGTFPLGIVMSRAVIERKTKGHRRGSLPPIQASFILAASMPAICSDDEARHLLCKWPRIPIGDDQ